MAATLGLHRAGRGEPLVLLHGGTGTWAHWYRAIPAFAAHFDVLALDLPGMGDSADLPNDGNLEVYLDLIGEAIDAVIGPARVFRMAGFSVGGLLAAATTARMPDRVQRLALVAPGGYDVAERRVLDLRGPRPDMSDAEIDAVHRHNLGAAMLADPNAIDAATVRVQRRNIETCRYDTRRIGFRRHVAEWLPDVRCPLLMLWGGNDLYSNPSIHPRIERLRALAPHAEIHLVPGAGHWVQYERADIVNPVLVGFLRGTGGARAART